MSGRIDQRIDEVFARALELSGTERSDYVEEACGSDVALRAELESLLAHDASAAGDFMRAPEATDPRHGDAISDYARQLVGQRVARYTIRSVIASGGMGTVYRAEQDDPKRIVALKIVHAGVVSKEALRRFRHESAILARLQHPGIAPVYEAGTFEDPSRGGTLVPFFAMEYVADALSVRDFVSRNQLSVRDVLAMFAKVCDAVHHGHQKGIIHRDLKPANILVDTSGRLRVIDFGVARCTDSDVALTTMHTDVGQLIGTLQYMSPEQCDADPLGLDTRSDVYSLGVILFELLAGELPYDASGTTIYQATRIIKEDEPRRLSVIQPKLRGDVETIVLKALEKDREKRYASAAALAEDLGRFLRGEPIDASAPTPWTRSVRWVARHPVAGTATLALFVSGLIIGIVPSVALWYGSRQPNGVSRSIDGQTASVISAAGNVLYTWQGNAPYAVSATGFARYRGDPLAIVGFAQLWPGDFGGKLCVFDARRPDSKAIWCSELTDEQIPPTNREGFSPEDFAPHQFSLMDVFPEVDGPEIVVPFVNIYSWRMIRIYALDGRLLYQVWHDGAADRYYWMPGKKQLVVVGSNDECYWQDRGYEGIEKPTPGVLFALRPRLGKISSELIDVYCRTGDDCPVWYHYIAPPRLNDIFGVGVLVRPEHRKYDADDHVQLRLPLRSGPLAYYQWILNDRGEVVSSKALTGDGSNRLKNPPDLSEFSLRDFNELQACPLEPQPSRGGSSSPDDE